MYLRLAERTLSRAPQVSHGTNRPWKSRRFLRQSSRLALLPAATYGPVTKTGQRWNKSGYLGISQPPIALVYGATLSDICSAVNSRLLQTQFTR